MKVFDKVPLSFKNTHWYIWPALIVFVFNLSFFNRYFPLSEGWFETYGYLINKGYIPYKDFNLAFPPLYVFLVSFLQKILLNSFFCLRMFGIVLFSSIVFFLQVILGKFFSKKIAAIAAVSASFLYISNPTFIAKDYHSLVDFFIVISLILVFLGLRDKKVPKGTTCNKTMFIYSSCFLFLLGIDIALLTLTKQNIGIFLFLAYLICIIQIWPTSFVNISTRVISYIFGFLIIFYIFYIWCSSFGIPLESIRNLYFGNDSKGGAFTVLTRFLTDKYNLKVEIISLIIVIIYLLLKMLPYGNDIIDKIKEKLSQDNVKFVVSGLFVLIAFWGCSGLAILNHTYSDLIIPLSLGVLLIMAVNAYIFFEQGDGSKNYRLIILPLLTLAYCNTQTAGYNFAGMFFIISFSSAYLITYLLKIIPINSAFIYTLLLCVIPSVAIGKAMTQYSWWGLRQSNIINAKYEIDNKELEGIYVDDITKKIFTLINRSINSYSKKENDVYLFPSIPIFYLLNNKIPGTPNIVQWFDVISSKDIEQEYDFIAKSKPRVIIALIPPKIVFDGHAQLIKRDLYQEKIIKLMKKNVLNNKYKLVSFEIVDQELEYKYKNRDIVKAIVAIVNDNYIGMPISKIYNDFKFVLNDLELSLPQKGDTLQPIIRKGDILRVTVRRDGLSAIVKALGWMNSMTSEKDYSYYTVLILVRSND